MDGKIVEGDGELKVTEKGKLMEAGILEIWHLGCLGLSMPCISHDKPFLENIYATLCT